MARPLGESGICPNGHSARSGDKFCPECASPLAAAPSTAANPTAPLELRYCPAGHAGQDNDPFCATCGIRIPEPAPASIPFPELGARLTDPVVDNLPATAITRPIPPDLPLDTSTPKPSRTRIQVARTLLIREAAQGLAILFVTAAIIAIIVVVVLKHSGHDAAYKDGYSYGEQLGTQAAGEDPYGVCSSAVSAGVLKPGENSLDFEDGCEAGYDKTGD